MLSLDAPAAKLFAMSSSLLQKFHHQTQGTKFLHINLESHLGMIFNFSVQDERLGFHLLRWVINLQMATLHNFNSWVKSHLRTREPNTILCLVYSISVRFRLLLNSDRWCLEVFFHFHDLGIRGYVFFLQIYVLMLDPVFNFLLKSYYYKISSILPVKFKNNLLPAKDRR